MTENYLNILAETIRNNWDQPALTDFYLTEDGSAQDTSRGNHYTYGEMYGEILRLGELFRSLGLQKGDHIAICGANSAHWSIAYLAVAAYQGVAVTILYGQAIEDIAHQIDFSDAKTIFTDKEIWAELKSQSLPQIEHVVSLENWQLLRGKEIVNHQSHITNHQCQFIHGNLDELAMICFTSGSTGGYKGVMLPYRSLTNNMRNTWDVYPKSVNQNTMLILPLAHTFGMTSDFIGQITLGKHLHILKDAPTPYNVYHALLLIRPYALTIIPALLLKLYERYKDAFIEEVKKSCSFVASGGACVSVEMEEKFSNNGILISVGYGQTETGPAISGSSNKFIRPNSCGQIFQGMEARIALNSEILVKGENVMLGYYKDPEATAAKIDADGWLHTGDKGHLDEDGYLYVEGRLEQDIIVLPNGENIRPDNIEALINALPEVSESIVLARNGHLVALVVPDNSSPKLGEVSQRDGGVCIENTPAYLRRKILRDVNPQLPDFSQLYDVEITDTPLQQTEKQTIKRYLYK